MIILIGLVLIIAVVLIGFIGSLRSRKTPSQKHDAQNYPRKIEEVSQHAQPAIDNAAISPLSDKSMAFDLYEVAPLQTYPNVQSKPRAIPEQLQKFKLLELNLNDSDTAQKITEIIALTPRPHPILKSLTHEIDSADELYFLIKDDPKIVERILNSVNSISSFSLTQEITDLNRAIFLLGLRMVQDIALSVALGNKQTKNTAIDSKINKLWSSNLLASSIGLLLAKNLLLANTQAPCTSVLFNSIGIFGLLMWKPQSESVFFEKTSLLEQVTVEQKKFGLNSASVGGALAADWELPTAVTACISNNLLPLAVPPAECELQEDELRNVVFAYTVCRIGEQITYGGVNDIADINLFTDKDPDLFYLPEYCKLVGIDSLTQILKDPYFRKRANQIIQQMRPTPELA